MIKIVLVICILLLLYLYFRNNTEKLYYDENTYQTLKEQEKLLIEEQNQYDSEVPREDKISNDCNIRDKLLYTMNF
jgi:hypothetical protein